MGPMPNRASTHCGTWRVLPGGMSEMFRLLFLGNGWTDCAEILYALGAPLVAAYAVVTGGVSVLDGRDSVVIDTNIGKWSSVENADSVPLSIMMSVLFV